MNRKLYGWFCWLGIWLWLSACVPATADTEPIVAARPPQPQWPDEVMWVRPEGAAGALVAYNMGNGRSQFSLPPGLLAADQQQYVAASPEGDATLVQLFDPEQGTLLNSFLLDGRWQLKGVSPNGRWLAFLAEAEKQSGASWQTEIAVVAAEDGRFRHNLQLDGHFDIDALSNSGQSLFLIQHVPPDQPEKYVVRLYNLAQNELAPEPLRDKRATDEIMTGYAWGTVADKQGVWWHTLYVSTQRNKAFIHALNLQPNGFTVCLDLPSGAGDFATLQQYALALAADGHTIYAANAALGIVAEVSLQTYGVVSEVAFAAVPAADTAPASVLATDGSQLFFTNGRQIWAYDTAEKTVSTPYLADSKAPVQGLGISQDGERLVVAWAERPLQVFDVASGSALAFPLEVSQSDE